MKNRQAFRPISRFFLHTILIVQGSSGLLSYSVYVCTLCMYTLVHMHVEVRDRHGVSFRTVLHFYFLRQVLLTLKFIDSAWLKNELQKSASLPNPQCKIIDTCHHENYWHVSWVLETRAQILILCAMGILLIEGSLSCHISNLSWDTCLSHIDCLPVKSLCLGIHSYSKMTYWFILDFEEFVRISARFLLNCCILTTSFTLIYQTVYSHLLEELIPPRRRKFTRNFTRLTW